MKKTAIIFLTLFMITAIISGCGQDTEKKEQNDENSLQVFTTVYPLQYFTEQIGGEYVNVETIYPPGADEHTFEPSQKDMIALADADLFLYVGLGLEGFVDKASKTLKNEDVTMMPVGEKIQFTEDEAHHNEEAGHDEEASHDEEAGHDEEASHDEEAGHDHGGVDPHVWLDPIYSIDIALAIKNQLTEQMPEHKETFENNYAQLSDQLEKLDQKFTKVIDSAKRKEIIVSHSAFSYWEKRYGIEQISISGLSTTNEPSQKELQNLISHAKEEQIKYVLNEQNFDSKLAKMVQNSIGAKLLILHNLSVLTDENLKNDDTYFTLMEDNIATLNKALNE